MPNKPNPNITHLSEEIFAQVEHEIYPLHYYRDIEKASLEEIWRAVRLIGTEEAIQVYGQLHETRTFGRGRSLQMCYKALIKMAKTWSYYRAVELARGPWMRRVVRDTLGNLIGLAIMAAVALYVWCVIGAYV